jgi:hypothetical protein
MRYYERALAVDPNSAQTLNNMGYSYLLQGKEDLAVVYLSEASRARPEDETITANLQSAEARLATSGSSPSKRLDTVSLTGTGLEDAPRVQRTRKNEYRLETQSAGLEPVEQRRLQDDPRTARKPARPAPEQRPDQIVLSSRSPAPAPAPEPMHSSTPVPKQMAKAGTEPPKQNMNRAPVVEVSNGAGRRRMASRMRAFLGEEGIEIQRLTNADNFAHQSSTVFYRPGWEAEAEILASHLPVSVSLMAEPNQQADVRLELGGDLLAFDAKLLERSSEPVQREEPEEKPEEKPDSDLTS